jgi:hypothetical protein
MTIIGNTMRNRRYAVIDIATGLVDNIIVVDPENTGSTEYVTPAGKRLQYIPPTVRGRDAGKNPLDEEFTNKRT